MAALIGESVALTLSSNTGVVDDPIGLLSLPAWVEFRLELACLGLWCSLCAPRAARRSSGICCAVVSSTKILRTFRASLPKLKKEKKY